MSHKKSAIIVKPNQSVSIQETCKVLNIPCPLMLTQGVTTKKLIIYINTPTSQKYVHSSNLKAFLLDLVDLQQKGLVGILYSELWIESEVIGSVRKWRVEVFANEAHKSLINRWQMNLKV